MKKFVPFIALLLTLCSMNGQNFNNNLTLDKSINHLIIKNSADSMDIKAKLMEENTTTEGIGIYINAEKSNNKNYGIISHTQGIAKYNTSYFGRVSGASDRNVGGFYIVEGESMNIGLVNHLKNGTANIGLLNSITESYNNKTAANMGIYNKILNNGNGKSTTYNHGIISSVSGSNNTNIAFLGYLSVQTNDEGIKVYPDNSENYLFKGEIKANDSRNKGVMIKVSGENSNNDGIHVEVDAGISNRAAYFKGDVMFESINNAPYFMWHQRKGYIISGHGAYPNEDKMGVNSLSVGMNTFAYDNNSGAIGEGLITHQPGQLVIGNFNYVRNDTSKILTAPLFQVGNGRIGKRSNAFEVNIEGRTFQDWIGINQPDSISYYAEMDSPVTRLLMLEGVKYGWNNEYGHPTNYFYGFDLESFRKNFPSLIHRNSEAENTLNTVALIPVLTEAFKEMNAKNQEQEKLLMSAFEKIQLLEKSLEELSSKLVKPEEDTDSDKNGME